MASNFQVISHLLLSAGATINQTRNIDSKPVRLEDNAKAVMTDFKHTRPFSITSSATIDEANNTMIAGGVRMLFVADPSGVLQGLITYTDLFGEKPVKYINEHGGRRNEILVQDIMTPLLRLETLQHQDVIKACVGDVVQTIITAGRQHMLVTTTMEDGIPIITGIFSSSHVEKMLGIKIELSTRANTFAELERAIT